MSNSGVNRKVYKSEYHLCIGISSPSQVRTTINSATMKTQFVLILALAVCALAADKKDAAVEEDSKTVEKRGVIGLGYGGVGYGGLGYGGLGYSGLGYGYGVAPVAPLAYSRVYSTVPVVAPRVYGYGGYPYSHGLGYGYGGYGYGLHGYLG